MQNGQEVGEQSTGNHNGSHKPLWTLATTASVILNPNLTDIQ